MTNIFPASSHPERGDSPEPLESQALKATTPSLPKPASKLPDVVGGHNPLVIAANSLLNLFPQVRGISTLDTAIKEVRAQLHSGFVQFREQAHAAGVNPKTLEDMGFCLCTVLDEAAAQTPWGTGVWQQDHSLLVEFYGRAGGGEEFFEILTRLLQAPSANIDAIELLYFCLMLGFEGRFKVRKNGRSDLETIQAQLLQVIENTRGTRSGALSEHWQGVLRKAVQPWTFLPLWIAAALSVLVGFAIFLWFSHKLALPSDELFTDIQRVRFPKMAVIAQEPQPALQPSLVAPRLQPLLQPEISQGLVEVKDNADRSTLLLRGDGLFAPGSSNINSAYLRLIERLAQALNEVPGKVWVNGYTDNIAIRTARFPSNWDLSQARAEAVLDQLALGLRDRNRLRAQGQGDSSPIAPNTTVQGRARNRRVEIVLMVAPRSSASEAALPASGATAPITTPAQSN